MNTTKTRTFFPLVVLCSVLLLGVIGCSRTGTITGTVKYDGKPVAVGIIQFIPEKGKAISADIADGEYTAKGVAAGPCTVTVSTKVAEDTAKTLPKGDQVGPGITPGAGGGAGAGGGGKNAPNIEEKTKDKKPGMPGDAELKEKKTENERYKRLVPVPAKYGDPEEAKKNPDQNFTVKAGSNEFNLDLPKVESAGGQKPKKK